LGGSITRGGGARSEELKYVARFFNAINASFPHRDHVFANKGSSAATSFFFAPCMSYHAPEGADLVVVEVRMDRVPCHAHACMKCHILSACKLQLCLDMPNCHATSASNRPNNVCFRSSGSLQ
jgi:hypothetical protein